MDGSDPTSGISGCRPLVLARSKGEEARSVRAVRLRKRATVSRADSVDSYISSVSLPSLSAGLRVTSMYAAADGSLATRRRIRSMPNDEAAMDAMRARRVPMAPVLTVAEAVKHPHLRQRGTIRKVHDRALGDFELLGFALRFSDFPRPLDLRRRS
jgi:hypothetical protein